MQQDPRLDLTLLASLALGMIFVSLVPSYKSVLQPTYSSLTARPISPPLPIHLCHVRLPSTRNWEFFVSARPMEPWFAREMAFGKLSKGPLPLQSLRPQDYFVTGRKSLYSPPFTCPLTCGRRSSPFSRHLARLLIACSSPFFGHGYTCFNFVFQIRVWTPKRTRQTNHGDLSLQDTYPSMVHVIYVGCCCLSAFPFL